MAESAGLLGALGGEAGCRRLAEEFYARVGGDPVLRRLFPGKSLRCAIEEFSAFLIQLLGGDEEQTQKRWWLSLRESHARFRIGEAERRAWLRHMTVTLKASELDDEVRRAMLEFFECGSTYVTGKDAGRPEHDELGVRWDEQRHLDEAIAVLACGGGEDAIGLVERFRTRPSIFVGLLARMLAGGREDWIAFVVDAVERTPVVRTSCYGGRALLHSAAATGCGEVVAALLDAGVDPNLRDRGGHGPLYSVANECRTEAGAEVVRMLVRRGADVNARGGVTEATALHMAARRGSVEIAKALLDCGAEIDARDRKGVTPLERAKNLKRSAVVELLIARGASRLQMRGKVW